jgi:hypothetical protein
LDSIAQSNSGGTSGGITSTDSLTITNSTFSGSTGIFSGDVTIGGNLTVDSNTLVVDAANNRVGVGTSSPTDTFSVNGPIFHCRFKSGRCWKQTLQ